VTKAMQTDTHTPFKKMVDEASRQLVSTEHHAGSSFVRLPLLYPSGANVVVKVDSHDSGFFVSDAGFGYQEADMMGGALIYARHGRSIADNAGVRFDNQAFFVVEASRDQLPGAVVTIANCSQEAAALAAYKIAERKTHDDEEALYERLVRIFPKANVAKHVEIIGSSMTKWPVAVLVKTSALPNQAIFESVAKHHSSVYSATAKFHDIARLERAPKCVAVVRHKAEFGPWLGLLAQAASVIDETVDDNGFVQFVEAA
jgi:hypothetical protein